jgi:nicotinate-nucleotide adenylyltransferase
MYPNYEFYFIMGADSLDYFEKWRNPEIIASLCKILVINRDEFTQEDMEEKILRINQYFPANIQIVKCKKYDVSSTEIRNGKKLEDVFPEVKEYMLENHLYGL